MHNFLTNNNHQKMKTLNFFMVVAVFAIATLSQAQEIKPAEVIKVMQKVADWQIDHYDGLYSGHEKPHHPLDWTNGALYVGMVKWAAMADNDKYYEWLRDIGEKHEWKLHRRKYHADDHTVGQMYAELYRKYGDENMLGPTKEQFNFIMYHPAQTSLQWRSPYHQSRWNWCDALFMSPPVWAKLYKITGEEKYLDFMVAEYKATTDFLFDKEANLYYRDESYMGKLDNGTKIFWSRGNGWVFAGLTNIMNELNPQSKEYKYFLKIYKKMAKKLLEIQTPEGHWSMSLLGQEFYPTPETSGSSFYTYGLAWGINKGILDKATYAPAVIKGWNAMVSHVTQEGMLGYVQPIGAAPGKAWPDKSEVYGTGAFLSAGSEVYKLVGGE
jgi:rhamnogalacturonyl hydrolase YesR